MALEEKDVYLNCRDTFSLVCFFFYDSDCPVSIQTPGAISPQLFFLIIIKWLDGGGGEGVVGCRLQGYYCFPNKRPFPFLHSSS